MSRSTVVRWVLLSVIWFCVGAGCMVKTVPEDPRDEPMMPLADVPQPLPPLMGM